MAYGVVNADLMTTSDGVSSSGLYGFKNRILNGQMVIDQRNAGASITSATNGAFSVDRWGVQNNSGASRFTLQQNAGSVTPPAGFANYLGITSTSAYSVTSNDACATYQNIEGYNIADFAWGTANAQPITLSFWVRSSLTGTFGGALQNSGGSRTYPFSYTISSANTWEQKSITIAGETTGTWLSTNGIGVVLMIGLGVGSNLSGTAGAWSSSNFFSATGATSVVGTNGATFYITGVQLEVGSTATSFDYRPYGTELQLCQRYCNVIKPGVSASGIFSGVWYTATSPLCSYIYPVAMRAAPSLTISAASDFIAVGGNNADATSAISMSGTGTTSTRIDITASVSRTAGHGALIQTANSSASLTFSAEL